MLFNRDVPKQISKVKLSKWYKTLGDRDKVRISRYLDDVDTSSKPTFLLDLMRRANAEENYPVTVKAGELITSEDFNDMEMFDITNEYIDALFGSKDYDKAKEFCLRNLDILPKVYSDLLDENGDIPKNLPCRNKLIDIMVGIELDYDGAEEMLQRFNDMNILRDEEQGYRKQSLKIHRLQRTFDSVYSYEFTE